MKRMNVVVIYDKNRENVLMCKRTKEPYKGLYNLVGGKIEKDNDGLNEAYRELEEETAITRNDVDLIHFMNFEYIVQNFVIEVYFGILKHDVKLVEEVNKLEWKSLNDDMCCEKFYAGNRNIGHIISMINDYLEK